MKSLRRIYGIVLRQVYLLRRSLPRLLSFIFWPTLFMFTFGFMNKYYLLESPVGVMTFNIMLGAALLLGVYERFGLNIMWSFLEDVWSRNIGNIMISPIASYEVITAYIINGLFAIIIGVSIAWTLAYLTFDYTLFKLGISVLYMIVSLLLSGIWIGIFLISLLLRFGPSGETFGFMLAYLLSPFYGVYYPVTVLPEWIQPISWFLPLTYIFEGLRNLNETQLFDMRYFFKALGLNAIYTLVAVTTFLYQLRRTRAKSGLFSLSE